MQALTSLAGLPSRQADDAVLDKAMYFVALEGVSRYALSEAVKAVMRNRLGHTFFPSPVELRRLCDEAMEPHIRQAQRERLRLKQAEENAEFARSRASRTPAEIERVKAKYAKFCESYEPSKPVAESILDPELVARVPDAPNTFQTGLRAAGE